MNLLQILPAISRSEAGVWFAAKGLCQALGQLNQQVRVVGPEREDSATLASELNRLPGLETRLVRTVGPRTLEWPVDRREVLAGPGFDVVHVHGLWRPMAHALCTAPGVQRLPRIVSPHGMLEPWALQRSAWKKKIAEALYEGRTIHGSAALHALCAAEVASIRGFGYRGPVCVIPNGVETPAEVLRSPCPDPLRWRDLLFLGRVDRKKGLHVLLPAFARAIHAVPDNRWRLKIAGFGDASYEAELRRWVEQAGLGERISFLGPVFGKDKEGLLAQADAFVLPSFSEGLPMAILEAAAAGLPILCTEPCNLPEVFTAGAGCRISLDEEQQAHELIEFFGLPVQRLDHMGIAAREMVLSRFQWSQVAASVVQVYDWLAGKGHKPACVQEL
jgi:glycosyltransferase involved in cell wall biosynthesis